MENPETTFCRFRNGNALPFLTEYRFSASISGMDNLASLRAQKRALEKARDQLVSENVTAVSFEGRSLTRHQLREIREEIATVTFQINGQIRKQRGRHPILGDAVGHRIV